MTIGEALDSGILRHEPIIGPDGTSKGNRTVCLDGSYTFWLRPGGERPYRWARAEVVTEPEQAACTEGISRHGGCATLEEAMRTTVLLRAAESASLLRSRGCR